MLIALHDSNIVLICVSVNDLPVKAYLEHPGRGLCHVSIFEKLNLQSDPTTLQIQRQACGSSHTPPRSEAWVLDIWGWSPSQTPFRFESRMFLQFGPGSARPLSSTLACCLASAIKSAEARGLGRLDPSPETTVPLSGCSGFFCF